MNKKKISKRILLSGMVMAVSLTSANIYFNARAEIKQSQEVILNLNKDIEGKTREITTKQEQIETLNKEKVELNTLNEKIQDQNEKMKQENEKIKKDSEVTEKRKNYLEQRNGELEKELKKKKVNKEFNGKIIAVDIGHNVAVDSGSTTNLVSEDKLTKEVGMELIDMLEKEGFRVINVTPSPNEVNSVTESLNKRITKANENNVDLFVSVHFNSASSEKAQGTEVFYYNKTEETEKIGKSIISNFNQYGFKDRGLKKANFYVLKNAKMPALLVECAFIKNVDDMSKYDPYKMAENIFNGIKQAF